MKSESRKIKRNPAKKTRGKRVARPGKEVDVLFSKTNTDRHLIAKTSNEKNQKPKSRGESKIRIKRGNKTTYPACRSGSSPRGRPALEVE